MAIHPGGIPSQENFNIPVVTAIKVLVPSGIVSGQAMGLAQLNLNLLPVGIATGASHPTPTVIAETNILCVGIPSASGVGVPFLERPTFGIFETVVDDQVYETYVEIYVTVTDDYTYEALAKGV